MSVSVDDARLVVMNQYPGSFNWRDKVRKMPDKQVLAIYYSMLGSGKLDQHRKTRAERQSSKPKNNIHKKEKPIKPYSDWDDWDEVEQLKLEGF